MIYGYLLDPDLYGAVLGAGIIAGVLAVAVLCITITLFCDEIDITGFISGGVTVALAVTCALCVRTATKQESAEMMQKEFRYIVCLKDSGKKWATNELVIHEDGTCSFTARSIAKTITDREKGD